MAVWLLLPHKHTGQLIVRGVSANPILAGFMVQSNVSLPRWIGQGTGTDGAKLQLCALYHLLHGQGPLHDVVAHVCADGVAKFC